MQLNPVVKRIFLVQPSLNHLIQSAEFNNLTSFTCARPALVIHFWFSKLFLGPEVACDWKWNYSLKTQPRPQGFSLKKWVRREKALASAGHVYSLNILEKLIYMQPAGFALTEVEGSNNGK